MTIEERVVQVGNWLLMAGRGLCSDTAALRAIADIVNGGTDRGGA